MFGLSAVALTLGVGVGVDLSRAYLSRQKLSQVAVLACQYAARPSVVQSAAGGSAEQGQYRAKVNAFIASSLQAQKFQQSQTNDSPFTFTANGPADVSLAASVPTTLMKIANIDMMPITATSRCYDTPSEVPQRVPDGNDPWVVAEGFETPTCTNCYTYTRPDGTTGTRATPSNSATPAPGYTGSRGARWFIMGYCIEIDSVGIIKSTVPGGRFSAELDCDNGSGQYGNSSIATKIYLPAGKYELRYNYTSRVYYPDYAPTYICGSTAAETAWATSTRSSGGPRANVQRSNQINVYLDLDSTGSAPTHATAENGQLLAGSNLIDICVDASDWIERSIRIDVTQAGYYWLSFAADGANDSYGGQIDDIRFCEKSCTDTLDDSFPHAWLAANNGGVAKQLFADGFEAPVVAATYKDQFSTNGNMNLSYGTSSTPASGYGWPGHAASGWTTAPYNQVDVLKKLSASPSQAIELDASAPAAYNRAVSRPFLLVPGYYKVEYKYVAGAIFSSVSGTYCGATPAASNVNTLTGTASGAGRVWDITGTTNKDTNIVAMFMSHGQLASNPIGGGALNSATSYLNPNGTTSTTPTVAPNGINLASYNAAQVNPLLDICGYATAWQSRTAHVAITKTGSYWLTFSALGLGEQIGGHIDDIKLTAVGSLYTAAPAAAVTIPVPNPQPNAAIGFTGFSIVGNPLTPPAS